MANGNFSQTLFAFPHNFMNGNTEELLILLPVEISIRPANGPKFRSFPR